MPAVDRELERVPERGDAAHRRAEEEARSTYDPVGVDADRAGQVGVDAGRLDPPAEAGVPQHRGEGQDVMHDGADRLPHVEVEERPSRPRIVVRRPSSGRRTPGSPSSRTGGSCCSPAMPRPREATNTASSAFGSGVGGERPVDEPLDRRTPTTAATRMPSTAEGQNGMPDPERERERQVGGERVGEPVGEVEASR